MVKRICTFYFSPTGTTEKVVKHLAASLAEQLSVEVKEHNFTLPANRKEAPVFQEGDLVISGVPVVAGRVPNLLLKYLDTIQGNGALAVPVVLYGNRNYDDALIELGQIMEKSSMHIIAGAAFVGEHSFSKILAKGRPDKEDMEVVEEFAQKLAKKCQTDEPSSIKLPGEDPIRWYYQPRDRHGNSIDIRKVKPKTNENCIHCKLCAKICPMAAIDFNDVSQIPGICIKCCACEKKCPVGAKYFDDENYLYHKTELEEQYAGTRRPPEYYL